MRQRMKLIQEGGEMKGKERIREILEDIIKHHKAYCDGDLIGGSHPVDQALSQIEAVMKECLGEDKKHICILSNKDFICTGKLKEGRTLKDWIKKGYNNRAQEFMERWSK